MNFTRISIAAVVSRVVSIAIGFFVNTVLLADFYDRQRDGDAP
jgi:hypothetical protein